MDRLQVNLFVDAMRKYTAFQILRPLSGWLLRSGWLQAYSAR